MLFGSDSYLPRFVKKYDGSLADVAKLKSTLIEFSSIINGRKFKLVLDKGF
jgi:transposase